MSLTYDDFIRSLGDREYFGQRLGLDRIREVLRRLGNPQDKFPSIHIAGTNGKGSTAVMLASILEEAGLRVGLFTSPHLEDFCERIRVGHRLIQPEDVLRYEKDISRVASAEDPLTFFEVSAAMAFLHFAAAPVDVAVLETGLGGRLDATNVVTPVVSVITTIGLDHGEHLGNTIGEIAREKAGIIKPGVPVVIGRMSEEARAVIAAAAHERGSQLVEVTEALPADWRVGLAGEHQRDNAALAKTVIEFMKDAAGIPSGPCGTPRTGSQGLMPPNSRGPVIRNSVDLLGCVRQGPRSLQEPLPRFSDRVIQNGLASVTWSGRLETVSEQPWILLDGAHNPQAMAMVRKHLQAHLQGQRLMVLFGAMADKDIAGMLGELASVASKIVITAPALRRAADPYKVEKLAQGLGLATAVIPEVSEAFESVRSRLRPADALLVTGSFFLVGDIRRKIKFR